MLAFRYRSSIAAFALVLSAPVLCAQQPAPSTQPQQPPSQQPQQNGDAQPIPAYRSPLASAADNSGIQEDTSADQLVPDTRLPAGAQSLTLGAPKLSHVYLQPHVDAMSSTYTGPTTTYASISGGLDLREVSGPSNLTLAYLGGGSISSDGSNNSVVQELGVVEKLTMHRTIVSLIDQASYFPQASFGYNGLGTGALSVGGNIGLQAGFTTDQSILTTNGQYIANSSLLEVDRYLTRRTSLTFVGDYNLVHYINVSNADNNEATFQAGYNYQLSRKSTISVIYGFDAFRYTNNSQSINSHSVELSYARRIVGRMALRVSGGPSFAISQFPLSVGAASTSTTTSSGKTNQLMWNANVDLTYQFRRAELEATYSHGVTGGSGVLAGAVSDTISGQASRQFTRNLNLQWGTGYSRNTGLTLLQLSPTTVLAPIVTSATNQTFNYWFTGVNLNRRWGPFITLNAGYQFQYQNSGTVSCLANPCSTSFLNHQFSVGIGWHPRPVIRR